MTSKQRILLTRIIISAALTVAGYIFWALDALVYFYLPIFILASLTVGYKVLSDALYGLIHGHILDENFLMTLGSIGAFILGEYAEGTIILLLYQVGELFESIAVGKSRGSISSLLNLRADYANVLRNGVLEKEEPESIEIGTEIHILPGERVPIDCVVISGESDIDTSALTGESLPQSISAGKELLSGCINLTGTVICKTVKSFENSAVSNILNMVENAASKKTQTESFVTRFAKYYTPIVVALAAVLFTVPSIFSGEVGKWGYRAIMFLVVSCPCALVVSVPLTFFGAIGGASKKGILIKGSRYIEILSKAKTAVFDKTGTITRGSFEITDICPNGVSDSELLKYAAICEYNSKHPIALSIKNAFSPEQYASCITDYKILSGKGAQCNFDGKILLAGNSVLMEENGISYIKNEALGTIVYVAYGTNFLGSIVINDTVKGEAPSCLSALKRRGFNTVMLTGDKKDIAKTIADISGIDKVYAELLPTDKVTILEDIIKNTDNPVLYVGDGINDAPVLARADIGISMGKIGSDAAIEASDIVIMNDNISLLPTAVHICKKAMRIAKQNIAFSLIIKFSMLALSVFGISNIYMAVFADVGVLILAILNSLRTMWNN